MMRFPYAPYEFTSRKIATAKYIDSTDCIHAFIQEIRDKFPMNQWLSGSRVKYRQEADWLVNALNNDDGWNSFLVANICSGGLRQEFTYVESNLRGFVFYFICWGCEKRVKKLYKPNERYRYRCRDCHKLHY